MIKPKALSTYALPKVPNSDSINRHKNKLPFSIEIIQRKLITKYQRLQKILWETFHFKQLRSPT